MGLVGPSGSQLGVPEWHWPGRPPRDGKGDAFGKIESKKTVDQFIADQVAGDTPLRSIEVGTEDMGTAVGACDGFACTFFNTLVVARRFEARCRWGSIRALPSSGCSARRIRRSGALPA